jgi:hypothetical protein
MPTWQLEDADALAAAHKYTFYKPSRQLIGKVKPGEVVKLIFKFDTDDPEAPGGERMWVLVDSVEPDGTFRGRLNNEPRWITDLKLDDPLSFNASHIINTEHDDDDNLVESFAKRCFVTNRILRDGAKVGYLYREEPDEERDSGWRFTANDESDEYMGNTDNIAYVSVGLVLSHDDSFVHLLDSPSGASFAWDAKRNEFVQLPGEA